MIKELIDSVEEESEDLNERLDSLKSFLSSEKRHEIEEGHVSLLRLQKNVMATYAHILAMRLSKVYDRETVLEVKQRSSSELKSNWVDVTEEQKKNCIKPKKEEAEAFKLAAEKEFSKKEEVMIEENKDLRKLIRERLRYSEEGINRALAYAKAPSLQRYPVTLYYKCNYEFKESKCHRHFTKKLKVTALSDEDAVNLCTDVYNISNPFDYRGLRAPDAICPHCVQTRYTGVLVKVRCHDTLRYLPATKKGEII